MLVKVRFPNAANPDDLTGREYTYRSDEPLAVGDHIIVPVRDTTTDGYVSAIDIPRDSSILQSANNIAIGASPQKTIAPWRNLSCPTLRGALLARYGTGWTNDEISSCWCIGPDCAHWDKITGACAPLALVIETRRAAVK